MTALGTVTLVGAGPGEPDLLTLRAVRALQTADVVFYDGLVDARVIALAEGAIKVSVAKRCQNVRQGAQTSQEAINRLLVRTARRGKNVVRLKCGDPFVFGRGGEEALACARAGVACCIVPGVSTAIAAASAARVPVTHRGSASAFVVTTGHPERVWTELVRSVPTRGVTLVMMMGLAVRAAFVRELLARGFAASTPACIVLGAHSARQRTWMGTIATLAAWEIPADCSDLPGTVIVGEVVDVGRELASKSTAEDVQNVSA